VDTAGLILAVLVHSAAWHDHHGARLVMRAVRRFRDLRLIWADGAYKGKLVRFAAELGGWHLRIVPKPAGKGFSVLPRRWVVERTFAWLGRYRRLSRDYEERTDVSRAMILLASINLMTHRLVPG
jgi:putative transposase